MSKEKKTAKDMLLARIAALSRKVQASADSDLQQCAEEIDSQEQNAELIQQTKADKAKELEIVKQSTGVDAGAAADDQNARANANWPMSWTGRTNTASRLVNLARRDAKTAARMLAIAKKMRKGADEDEDEDDEECIGCAAASKLVKMAMKRTQTASSMMKMARKAIKADDAEEVEEDVEEVEASYMPLKHDGKKASTKTKVAARLVALAKSMMADDDDDDACASVEKLAGDVPPQFKENIEKMKDKAKDKDASSSKVAEALVQLAKSLSADEDEEDDASK